MKMSKEFEGKKLLVLGGIKYECDIVEHAQKMGAYTIVADYDTDSPAKSIADKAVLIDATDVNKIVEFCKSEKVDGITTGFVDILLPGWIEMCKELELPCYATSKMLSMSTDKVDFKRTCEQYGVPVPKTFFVGKELTQEVLDSISYPVFVKPLDASGSRGCGVCKNAEEVEARFREAVFYSPTDNVIIEEYLTGHEFLLDYIGVDGEFRLLEMFDRYMGSDRESARNFSNVSLAPSFAIDNYYANIDEKVRNMFKKLGFKDGLIFLQGTVEGERITFYEMGCRLGGSFFDLEQACLGMNAVDMIIRHALTGKMMSSIDDIPEKAAKFSRFAAVNNFLLAGGKETIAKIKGVEEAKKLPTYVTSIQYREEGLYYIQDSIVDKPVISIYFTGQNIDEIKSGIRYLNDNFKVTNSEGRSLLMDKINPEEIEDYYL